LSATVASQNGLSKIIGHGLWLEQLKAIGITIALALIGTSLIGFLVRATVGLRIAPEIERQGLDINLHGEEGYIVCGYMLEQRIYETRSEERLTEPLLQGS